MAFRTVDNGANWTDISSNLRGVPLNAVVIDPNTSPHAIIVATDTGVQRSMDFGATWQPLGFALPNVHCTSLAIDPSATIGEGSFVGAYAVIGRNVRVGERARIYAHAIIYDEDHTDPLGSTVIP